MKLTILFFIWLSLQGQTNTDIIQFLDQQKLNCTMRHETAKLSISPGTISFLVLNKDGTETRQSIQGLDIRCVLKEKQTEIQPLNPSDKSHPTIEKMLQLFDKHVKT